VRLQHSRKVICNFESFSFDHVSSPTDCEKSRSQLSLSKTELRNREKVFAASAVVMFISTNRYTTNLNELTES